MSHIGYVTTQLSCGTERESIRHVFLSPCRLTQTGARPAVGQTASCDSSSVLRLALGFPCLRASPCAPPCAAEPQAPNTDTSSPSLGEGEQAELLLLIAILFSSMICYLMLQHSRGENHKGSLCEKKKKKKGGDDRDQTENKN